jgi:NAD(P)-dependent dehydrogenase (short-subunit alcohol dehydrogenase family)
MFQKGSMLASLNRFQDQVVVVTGASKGIGQATAIAFGREGARVVVNYRSDEAGASETLAQIEAGGGRGLLLQADVSRPADVERLVAAAEAEGPIQVLVNNGAAFNRQLFLDVSLEEFDRVWATNVRGLFYLSQCVARHMVTRRQGCLIHVSSILARQLIEARAAYAASKGAVESLTFAMALDLAPYNIRVNAIVPGLIRTDALLAGVRDPARQEALQHYIPTGRFGTPDESAQVVLFLASEAAYYVNGALIPVDGGLGVREAGPR